MSSYPHLDFVQRSGGTRIAYTTWGSGLPLVRPPAWLSHQGLLGLSAEERAFAEALTQFSPPWMQVSYDKQGTGLSGRERRDFSVDGMVDELEAVVEHLELS